MVIVRHSIAVLDFHYSTLSHIAQQRSNNSLVLAVSPHISVTDTQKNCRLHFDFDAGRPSCKIKWRHPSIDLQRRSGKI